MADIAVWDFNGSDAKTGTVECTLAADALSRTTQTVTQRVSTCDAPYKGRMQYTFSDGSVLEAVVHR